MALVRADPHSSAWWAGVVLNTVIWLVFVAELAAILAVAPHRWQWMRNHPLDPLIVLLTPPIMPSSLQAARLLRLLRLLRLVRLAQVVRRPDADDHHHDRDEAPLVRARVDVGVSDGRHGGNRPPDAVPRRNMLPFRRGERGAAT
jgi:hypothetical protein